MNNLYGWLKIFFVYIKCFLISAEWYKNAGVHMLIIKKIWQNLGKYGKCTRWFKDEFNTKSNNKLFLSEMTS